MYRLTIKDLETGEIKTSHDVDTIFATGFVRETEDIIAIAHGDASDPELAGCMIAQDMVREHLFDRNTLARKIYERGRDHIEEAEIIDLNELRRQAETEYRR